MTLDVSAAMIPGNSPLIVCWTPIHSGWPSTHPTKSPTVFAAAVRTLSYPLSPATIFKLSHNEATLLSGNDSCGVIIHLLMNA